MQDALIPQTGLLTCRALDYAGTVPNACYNADGRLTIGMFMALTMFFLAIIGAWRRYL